ncbi:hypothetical protein EKO27_g7981 [Xylaria grammica]|uniref:F-box domain-containing protein n=1 Tax=Xylaria grammica TaxID=363999 RepID=A0A439CY14_9PEZI|nr:hypothetical protein EKO27_g7981 [Xylaria grammica]
MPLFELPPELVEPIFDYIVKSRSFERVMRIRIVSRRFKTCIDSSIFRLDLFSQLVGPPYRLEDLGASNYISTRSGSAAARALCERDGDVGNEALSACVGSLLTLAMNGYFGELFREPGPDELEKCSDEALKADIYVAAIWLGKLSYVESLIADGVEFCTVGRRKDVHSSIFGDAFHAAGMKGNLDMIKLLLSCIPEYRDTGVLPADQQRSILSYASMHGHEAAFDFAMNLRPLNLPQTEAERKVDRDVHYHKRTVDMIPFPKGYEQVVALLGPDHELFERRCPTSFLDRSSYLGNEEMVRYFLNKGVPPNYPGDTPGFSPLSSSILCGNETIIKLLLEAGADPNVPSPPYWALSHAIWMGSVSVVKMVLERVTDINVGYPPPIAIAVFKERIDLFRLLREHGARLDTPETGGWAMAVAKMHGLSSMVDVLVREGLSPDDVFHWSAPSSTDRYWWYYYLWPRQYRV